MMRQQFEDRVIKGSQEPVVHNIVAKIYIDSSNEQEQFLKEY